MRLTEGSRVVITGAASGIGEGLARECANRGFRLALADVEGGPVDQLAAELRGQAGATVSAHAVDVSNDAAVAAFARAVEEDFGGADLVIANAGVIGPRVPLWEQTVEDRDWTLGVNLAGVFNTWASFLPAMVERGSGHVVATSSIAGLAPIAHGGNTPYAASKYGIVGLADTLRMELADTAPNIGVTVVFPGRVNTRIRDAARNRPDEFGGPDAGPPPIFEDTEGLEPRDVAVSVLAAIEQGDRYLIPNRELVDPITGHLETVVESLRRASAR